MWMSTSAYLFKKCDYREKERGVCESVVAWTVVVCVLVLVGRNIAGGGGMVRRRAEGVAPSTPFDAVCGHPWFTGGCRSVDREPRTVAGGPDVHYTGVVRARAQCLCFSFLSLLFLLSLSLSISLSLSPSLFRCVH